MIDKEKFATGMGLLAGAFNRTVDAPVSRMYYGILGKAIDTEQFERAVALTLEQDSFWPSPATLLAKVVPDAEAQGRAALEHVNRVLSRSGGHRFLSHATFHAEFDAPTRAAISAIGGLPEITSCPAERYGTLSRKFAEAYAGTLHPTKRIAAPPTDPRVKQLVRETAGVMSGRDRAAGRQESADD